MFPSLSTAVHGTFFSDPMELSTRRLKHLLTATTRLLVDSPRLRYHVLEPGDALELALAMVELRRPWSPWRA
jgi:hypothetical protein